MPRFDIGATAKFQSRDGGITKGGLVRNGFLEFSGKDTVWSWMRPALATSVEAPFTGSGLGLFKVGTTLYGMGFKGTGAVGTAQSEAVTFSTSTTAFTLVAGSAATSFGFAAGIGSITPTTYKGIAINEVSVDTSASELTVNITGTLAQNFFTSINLNGSNFASSAASFSTPGNSIWLWGTSTPISAIGTYTGNFKS